MLVKICSCCREKKLISAFSKDRTSPDGHSYWCRQCHSLYKKRTEWHIKYRSEHRNEYRQRNRVCQRTVKGKARQALRNAVYRGKIRKPGRCQLCGQPKLPRELHGHHPDYRNQLSVLWLCHYCHIQVDCGLASIEYLPDGQKTFCFD
jgi:hypothetical protein